MTPTLQQLRYLVAVADCRSITAAACSVYIAQPALSRSIQSLERDLGVTLLDRRGRRATLTAEGTRVVRLARTVLDAVGAIEDVGTARRSALRATVNVAATPALCGVIAADLVPSFVERHPEIDVRLLRHDSREALERALVDGGAELGLVHLPVDQELSAYRLQDREIVLISPPGSELPDPVPLRMLGGLRVVLPPLGTGRRTELEAMFGRLGVRPLAVAENDERPAARTGVTEERGSLIGYRDSVFRVFHHRVEVRSFSPPLLRPVGIAYPPGPLSAAARSFLVHARHSAPAGAPAS
ncbi:LysR family transcriptional regulator [Streptomyces sp. NPDC006475]|uniref:LysR family transcriptional regulator n=1 Tax=Streptomyces sp. NPDC006475 TaxID=3155719 RepID=UPI0033AE5913